eukprot:11230586-Alexandrium_andersonii.AAC.1
MEGAQLLEHLDKHISALQTEPTKPADIYARHTKAAQEQKNAAVALEKAKNRRSKAAEALQEAEDQVAEAQTRCDKAGAE